jgi:hypothetical protein
MYSTVYFSGQVGDTLAHRAERHDCVKICFLISPSVCLQALELRYNGITRILTVPGTAPNYVYFVFLIIIPSRTRQ